MMLTRSRNTALIASCQDHREGEWRRSGRKSALSTRAGQLSSLAVTRTRPAYPCSRAGIARDCDGLITDRLGRDKISGTRCRWSAGRDRLLSVIVVEPSARLPAEPPGLDVFDEQRTRPVFAVGQPFIEHLHDRKAGVEPNEIGELERAHRVVGAELH